MILNFRRATIFWFALGFLGVELLTSEHNLHAEVHITGTLPAMYVTTDKDKIPDVLAALGNQFNFHYHTSVPLSGSVSGTYTGSFPRVLSRLLDGYNYVIKSERGAVDIVITGRRGESPIVQPEALEGITKRWR